MSFHIEENHSLITAFILTICETKMDQRHRAQQLRLIC